jgi:hypothetical protein
VHRRQTSEAVIKILSNFLALDTFMVPEEVWFDGGPSFTAPATKWFVEKTLGSKWRKTDTKRPTQNGVAEAFHKPFKKVV